MLAAAVLFAACDDKDNKYYIEYELSRSGKVSLVASIESMDTECPAERRTCAPGAALVKSVFTDAAVTFPLVMLPTL